MSDLVRRAVPVVFAVAVALWLVADVQHTESEQYAAETALRTARLAVREYRQMAADARQLLATIASRSDFVSAGPSVCVRLLDDALAHGARWAFLGIVDADGRFQCRAPAGMVPAGSATRLDALDAGAQFADAAPGVAEAFALPGIVQAAPLAGQGADAGGAVLVSLTFDWLGDFAAQAGLPPGSVLSVRDAHDRVLYRHPEGSAAAAAADGPAGPLPAVTVAQRQATSGSDPGGVARMVAVEQIGEAAGNAASIAVAVAVDAFAGSAARSGLPRIGAAAVAIGAAAWLVWTLGSRGPLRHRAVKPDGGAVAHRPSAQRVRSPESIRNRRGRLEEGARHAVALNHVYAMSSAMNAAIVRARSAQELVGQLCRVAVRNGRFPVAWYGELDDHGGRVRILDACAAPAHADALPPSGALDLADCGHRHAQARLRHGITCVCPGGAGNGGRLSDGWVPAHDSSVDAFVLLPIATENNVRHVLCLGPAARRLFDRRTVRLLDELAGDLSIGLTTLGRLQRIDRLAAYDVLTDLPNEEHFADMVDVQLAAAGRHRRHAAVVVLQIGRFAQLNHAAGRKAGDALLLQVAVALRATVRAGDIVARTGGGRFAVLLSDLGGVAEVPAVVDQLAAALPDEVHDASGRPVGDVTTQTVVALYPDDGANCRELLGQANALLTVATPSPRRPVRYCSDDAGRIAARRLTLEAELRGAGARGELHLAFQPIVGARDRQAVGVEGLVRWSHPRLGRVSPAEFVPVAEASGQMGKLGDWVLQQACTEVERLRQAGFGRLSLALNVSPLLLGSLADAESVYARCAALERSKGHGGLVIEITETALMEDIEATAAILRRLRDAGAEVAVDDFGTGYSSLAYLQQLPVDQLKIDRAFVCGLPDSRSGADIVAAIVALAHGLGLVTVAEGVETDAQRRMLAEIGCDYVQGHLISAALPMPELIDWLIASAPAARVRGV